MSTFSNQATIDCLRSTIVNALKDHCCGVASQQSSKLANIVRQVDKFLSFRNLGLNCLQRAMNSGCALPQLLAEIYHEGLRTSASGVRELSSLGLFGVNRMESEQRHQQQSGSLHIPESTSRNIKLEFQY